MGYRMEWCRLQRHDGGGSKLTFVGKEGCYWRWRSFPFREMALKTRGLARSQALKLELKTQQLSQPIWSRSCCCLYNSLANILRRQPFIDTQSPSKDVSTCWCTRTNYYCNSCEESSVTLCSITHSLRFEFWLNCLFAYMYRRVWLAVCSCR